MVLEVYSFYYINSPLFKAYKEVIMSNPRAILLLNELYCAIFDEEQRRAIKIGVYQNRRYWEINVNHFTDFTTLARRQAQMDAIMFSDLHVFSTEKEIAQTS